MSNQSSWIYEVNVKVDRSILDEYRSVVQHHIEAITALPGFTHANWLEQHDNPISERIAWVIQYHANSYEAIENYFQGLAPTLRADTVKYGSQVEAQRRVLKPAN